MEEVKNYKLTESQVTAIEMLLLKAINNLWHSSSAAVTMEQQEAFAEKYNEILLALGR